jgi:catechol 2,3-dioxygenase-like lactoylglutathione lyase family enzyme
MPHALRQLVVTVGAPAKIGGGEGRRVLARFYADLLGMEVVSEGWLRIAKRDADRNPRPLSLALDGDGWSDQCPPRWRDPAHPQQLHLDIAVPSMTDAAQSVERLGGPLLEDFGRWQVLADPAGHPFCIYEEPGHSVAEPTITTVTFDCLSPRSLAAFYEGLFGLSRRLTDEPERVVVDVEDDRFPNFAFQHAVFDASRWPDDAYPAQLHLDIRFEDGTGAAVERAERFGAIRLPKLADTEIFADPAGHPFCL